MSTMIETPLQQVGPAAKDDVAQPVTLAMYRFHVSLQEPDPEAEEDAADAATIDARRGDTTEPLDAVLRRLGESHDAPL